MRPSLRCDYAQGSNTTGELLWEEVGIDIVLECTGLFRRREDAARKQDVSIETVNTALKNAAQGRLQGIIDYNDDEIVSADIIGNPHSGIVDAPSTRVIMKRVGLVRQ